MEERKKKARKRERKKAEVRKREGARDGGEKDRSVWLFQEHAIVLEGRIGPRPLTLASTRPYPLPQARG